MEYELTACELIFHWICVCPWQNVCPWPLHSTACFWYDVNLDQPIGCLPKTLSHFLPCWKIFDFVGLFTSPYVSQRRWILSTFPWVSPGSSKSNLVSLFLFPRIWLSKTMFDKILVKEIWGFQGLLRKVSSLREIDTQEKSPLFFPWSYHIWMWCAALWQPVFHQPTEEADTHPRWSTEDFRAVTLSLLCMILYWWIHITMSKLIKRTTLWAFCECGQSIVSELWCRLWTLGGKDVRNLGKFISWNKCIAVVGRMLIVGKAMCGGRAYMGNLLSAQCCSEPKIS